MNCNCIEEINAKIQKATGDPEASLDIIYSFDNSIDQYIMEL